MKFSELTKQKEFFPINGNDEIELNNVINMSEEEFKNRFDRSPVKRAKLNGLKRNAEFLINDGNSRK